MDTLESRCFPLPMGLLRDDCFLHMSGRAMKVYFWLIGQYNGHNNGELTATYKSLRERLGMTNGASASALAELERRGFIIRGSGRLGHAYRYAVKIPRLGV